MRLGGPVFAEWMGDPELWAGAVRAAGYRAAYCPVKCGTDEASVLAYAESASRADVVIAEVGAWSNPLSPDPALRASALECCKRSLELAERIGARCCVNVAGSLGADWAGPYAQDLTEEAFQRIVETVREIIDAVRPSRTFYALETMPWMFPDSVDSYLRLLSAVDRKAFGAHLDPANLICSPQRYFRNAELVRECVTALAPHIRSCHAKDVCLRKELTVHIDEVRPGLGGLDYPAFLRALSALDPDTPLMLEHLPDEASYAQAADYLRGVAQAEGVIL